MLGEYLQPDNNELMQCHAVEALPELCMLTKQKYFIAMQQYLRHGNRVASYTGLGCKPLRPLLFDGVQTMVIREPQTSRWPWRGRGHGNGVAMAVAIAMEWQ